MQWLWKWITSLFSKEAAAKDERPSLFRPSERLIYRYMTGRDAKGSDTYVDADPMKLWKRLMQDGPEISINIKVSESQSKDARACHDKLMDLLRGVFGVKPFEEGGLTEIELRGLLDHFLTFVGWQKKNTPTSPTSAEETSPATPPSSVPEPAGESGPAEPQPSVTSTGSDSGSTESGSSSATPSP